MLLAINTMVAISLGLVIQIIITRRFMWVVDVLLQQLAIL